MTSRQTIAAHLGIDERFIERTYNNWRVHYNGGPSWSVSFKHRNATCDWTMADAARAIRNGGRLRIEWENCDGDIWVEEATARPAPAKEEACAD